MSEEWRSIAGFEGLYEVSDYGRVRSLDRVETWCRVIRGISMEGARVFKGKVLKPTPKASGHLHIALGRGNRFYVHYLVLTTFVGPRPTGQEALHWDDRPGNNNLQNLRWGTRSENLADFERNYGRPQNGRSEVNHA